MNKIDIIAEKTKLMTLSAYVIQMETNVKGQQLCTVTTSKTWSSCLRWWLKSEVLSRIAQATAPLIELKPSWRDYNISLGLKMKLMGQGKEHRHLR